MSWLIMILIQLCCSQGGIWIYSDGRSEGAGCQQLRPVATVGSGLLVWAGLDRLKFGSADRWGTRRCLTGWGWVATWPSTDYKLREEGKEIRLHRAAFLTSQLLSHHAEGDSGAKIPPVRHLSFLFFYSLLCLLCSSIHATTVRGTQRCPGA